MLPPRRWRRRRRHLVVVLSNDKISFPLVDLGLILPPRRWRRRRRHLEVVLVKVRISTRHFPLSWSFPLTVIFARYISSSFFGQ
jgi:hypothetical protein